VSRPRSVGTGAGWTAAWLTLLVLWLVAAAPSAGAEELTNAEYQDLLRSAANDPDALAELRSVTAVGGRPVDLSIVFDHPDSPVLAARLEELRRAAASGRNGVLESEPDRLRGQAAEILEGDKYQPVPLPRPFRRALRWLGERLQPIGDVFASLVNRRTVQVGAAGIVVTLAVLVAHRLIARRARQDRVLVQRRRNAEQVDPRALERRADEAAARGELDVALRLRFLAGLVRLELADRIHRARSATTGELRSQLSAAPFDRLAGQIDRVTYGERSLKSDDLDRARADWAELLGSSDRGLLGSSDRGGRP